MTFGGHLSLRKPNIMPTQVSSKSDVDVDGYYQDENGTELRNRGRNAGTDNDLQDMRMLGRTQQLNVR